MIIYQKWIKRDDLIANPELLYVFGDNVKRIGFGGQAAAMRGEPNAHGIATLWAPGVSFSDHEYEDVRQIIDADLSELARRASLWDVQTIVFPVDGVGTGLALMSTFCPRIKAYLDRQLKERFGITNGLHLVRNTTTLRAQLGPGEDCVET